LSQYHGKLKLELEDHGGNSQLQAAVDCIYE
jgi:hypothetical protein